MAEALEEFDIYFFEEPVLPEDPRALAEVAAAISIPIANGERLFTKWGFRDVLALGAADVLQPDLAHCGGILEARKYCRGGGKHRLSEWRPTIRILGY